MSPPSGLALWAGLTTAVLAAALPAPAPAQARVAPAAHCIDARLLAEVHPVGQRTLAVRAQDNTRALLHLDGDCAGIAADPQVRVLGHDGWLCGQPGEAVHSANRHCPITRVDLMDARDYAEAVRQAHANLPTLDAVVVTAPVRRGFGGTPDFCLRTRAVRGWQEDRHGLRVAVAPRQSAGHRYYRVELEGGCADIANAESLALVSGVGLGVVCGNPGDRAVFGRSQPSPAGGAVPLARPTMQPRLAAQAGCRISRVYPIDPE